jgi:hypothetical protein
VITSVRHILGHILLKLHTSAMVRCSYVGGGKLDIQQRKSVKSDPITG